MAKPVSDRSADSEKLTINLGVVDLGRIDLMVREGFYSNRSDFIRTAIRNQLSTEGDVVSRAVERETMDLGLRILTRETLEAAQARNERLHLKVVGLLQIAGDVTPELARATIASVMVLGAMQASPDIKAALKDRTT